MSRSQKNNSNIISEDNNESSDSDPDKNQTNQPTTEISSKYKLHKILIKNSFNKSK